jgi:hypothetical protein
LTEVQRFFEYYHSDHYFLYNLCQERDYDPDKFHGRMKKFAFYDHNAPPLHLIKDCCLDIEQWLAQDDDHIVGINCKAGKGRTGLIICCYLLHSEKCPNTDEALVYYGNKRTYDGKGVTIASQQRYIRYYEKILKELDGNIPDNRELLLTRVKIDSFPRSLGYPFVSIEINDVEVHLSEAGTLEKGKKNDYKGDVRVGGKVQGDVKVKILAKKKAARKQSLCHFWFNTGFIEGNKLTLVKSEIDVANKDKNEKVFKNTFAIHCFFKEADDNGADRKKSRRRKKKKRNNRKKDLQEKPKTSRIQREEKSNGEEEKSDRSLNETNGHAEVISDEDPMDEPPGPDDTEPEPEETPKRNNRKSFYDYSDYGQLQDQLELSQESDFTVSGEEQE